jgi:hypothetical protein
MAIGAEGDDAAAEAFVWGANVFRQDGTDMGMGTMIGGWAYDLGENIEDGVEGWQEEDKENVGIDFGIGEEYGHAGYSVGMNGDMEEYGNRGGDEDGDRVGLDMGMGVGLRGAYAGYGLEGLDLDLDMEMGMDMGQDDGLYPVEHLSEGLQPYYCCDNDNIEEENQDQDGDEFQIDRLEGDGHYGYEDRQEGQWAMDPMNPEVDLAMDTTGDAHFDAESGLDLCQMQMQMHAMDTEDEPAIDMFGTRVSELQREIFAGGRERW